MDSNDPRAQTRPWTVPQRLFEEALRDLSGLYKARVNTDPFHGYREPKCFHLSVEKPGAHHGWMLTVEEDGTAWSPEKAPRWVGELTQKAEREARERFALKHDT